jgi:hypothetical protein
MPAQLALPQMKCCTSVYVRGCQCWAAGALREQQGTQQQGALEGRRCQACIRSGHPGVIGCIPTHGYEGCQPGRSAGRLLVVLQRRAPAGAT